MRASVAFLLSYYIFGLCCFIGMLTAYPFYSIFPPFEWIILPFVLPIVFLVFLPYSLISIAYFAAFIVFYYYCYYKKRKVKMENVV